MAKRKDREPGRARVPVRLLACDDLGLVQGTSGLLMSSNYFKIYITLLRSILLVAGVQAPDYNRFEDAKVVSRW